jgi:hypothetical protein
MERDRLGMSMRLGEIWSRVVDGLTITSRDLSYLSGYFAHSLVAIVIKYIKMELI